MIVEKSKVIESTAIVWINLECLQKHLLSLGEFLHFQVNESKIEGCSGVLRITGQHHMETRGIMEVSCS